MAYKNLIDRCLQGEKSAQRLLYDKLAPKMYGLCLRYCTNGEDAQDAMQEGFIRMYRNLGKYTESGSFEGWVRRIMVNCSLTIIQKRKKRRSEDIDAQIHVGGAPDVEHELEAEALMGLITMLPDGYRNVFNMSVIEGYSHKEIGKMLQIKESTSRSQLMKARRMLQDLIAKNEKIPSS